MNTKSDEDDDNCSDRSEAHISKKIKLNDFDNDVTKNKKCNEENTDLKPYNTKSDGMEEMFKCTICSDIMYNCVSIRPCLHSFCGICLLEWIELGDDCPVCRGNIEGVSKNHLLSNIIDKYLEEHPDKIKPQKERDEADFKMLTGKNKLFLNKPSSLSSTYSLPVSLNGCPYCHFPDSQHSSITTIDLSVAPLSHYTCTSHVQCQCCNINVPLLNDTGIYPKQKCFLCNRMFCFLILGNCRNCPHGCLHIFIDFVLNPNLNSITQVPQFLPENYYETNVLRNYLNTQNITVLDMFKECLDSITSGELNLEQSIRTDDSFCLDCSRLVVLDMVYEYFRKIPKFKLPRQVTSRPDCYYGRHCRTQRTRQHHAVNYNHVCPQTRF